jgi:hypothetical protein
LGVGGDVKLASASEFGSTEARNDILRNKLNKPDNDPALQVVNVARQQLGVGQDQKALLQKLVAAQDNIVELRLP